MNDRDRQYRRDILKLISGMSAWCAEHPKAEVLVKVNRPKGVLLAISLSAAFERGLITTNAAGEEMLRAVGMDPSPENHGEPTLMMLEVALEAGNSPGLL